MYTQEIANIFDHIQGHSRLGLENKFLENKSGLCFLSSTGLLYKFLLTNLGLFKPTFYNWLLRITFEVKQYYLSYRPRTECGISQFFKTNCTQSIFRTINRGLLAKPFKKFPKSPIRPAGSHFYSASCQCGRVFEWTLIELRFNIIANLLLFVLLFNGFSYNDV